MKCGSCLIGGVGILVLALGLTAPALAAMSDGSLYNESFTGGTFDDAQSSLANETGSVGSQGDCAWVNPNAEALEINNVTDNDGWLLVTLDFPIAGGTEVWMESVVSVTQGAEISHHALIMQPQRADHEAIALAIKAYEVDATTWDLDVWYGDLAADSERAGLTLNKAQAGETIYYTVSQRILTGSLQAEVYVNDILIGTWPCNRPGPAHDLAYVRVGNSHAPYGFYNAFFPDVRIGPTGAASPSIKISDNSVFYETFDGAAFSEPTSSFVGDPVVDPNGIRFDNNAVKLVALAGHSSEYNTGAITGTVGVNDEYVIEVRVRISSAVVFFPNAYLMDPWNTLPSGHATGGIDLKLEAVDNGDPNDTWDVEVEDLTSASNAGLELTKDAYHYVAQHHLGDGNVDVYVDGQFVGTYTDRDASLDLDYVRLGNVSTGLGFGTAWFDSVSVGVPAPPCPELLKSDLNKDCEVSLPDFVIFSSEWLHCTRPEDPNCD